MSVSANLTTEFKPLHLSNNIINYNTDPFGELDLKPSLPFSNDSEEIIKNNNSLFLKFLETASKESSTKPSEQLIFEVPRSSVNIPSSTITLEPSSEASKTTSSKSSFDAGDVNLSLEEILTQEGVHYRITSGYRGKGSLRNGLTKQGKRSNHNKLDSKGNPMAYDVVPNGVSWKQFKKEIYGNPRIINYLKLRNWGILDEARKDVAARTGATGPHLHIGADALGRRMLASLLSHSPLRALSGIKLPDVNLVSLFSTDSALVSEPEIYKFLDNNVNYRNQNLFNEIYNYEPKEKEETEEDKLTSSPFYYREETQLSYTPQLSYIPQQLTNVAFQSSISTQNNFKGDSIQSRVMNYFLNKGLSKHAAAGIMGNLYVESRLNPSAIGDRGTSGGIAQWHGNRFTLLRMFAKKRNKDWKDLDTQLDFLWYELNSTYRNVYEKIRNAKDSDSVVNIWGHDYERFAGHNNFNNSNYRNRRKYAKYFNNL